MNDNLLKKLPPISLDAHKKHCPVRKDCVLTYSGIYWRQIKIPTRNVVIWVGCRYLDERQLKGILSDIESFGYTVYADPTEPSWNPNQINPFPKYVAENGHV